MPEICYEAEKVMTLTKEMTFSISQKKLKPLKRTLKQICQEATVLKLTKVLGRLTSTVLAIFSAKRHCCFLQNQQVQALKKNDPKSSVTEQEISNISSLADQQTLKCTVEGS